MSSSATRPPFGAALPPKLTPPGALYLDPAGGLPSSDLLHPPPSGSLWIRLWPMPTCCWSNVTVHDFKIFCWQYLHGKFKVHRFSHFRTMEQFRYPKWHGMCVMSPLTSQCYQKSPVVPGHNGAAGEERQGDYTAARDKMTSVNCCCALIIHFNLFSPLSLETCAALISLAGRFWPAAGLKRVMERLTA